MTPTKGLCPDSIKVGDWTGCWKSSAPSSDTHVGYMIHKAIDKKYQRTAPGPTTSGLGREVGRTWNIELATREMNAGVHPWSNGDEEYIVGYGRKAVDPLLGETRKITYQRTSGEIRMCYRRKPESKPGSLWRLRRTRSVSLSDTLSVSIGEETI